MNVLDKWPGRIEQRGRANAADIIGHEKTTMTYGLYSGGATLEVKREAIEKIVYPITA
jgi:hypothetical protein